MRHARIGASGDHRGIEAVDRCRGKTMSLPAPIRADHTGLSDLSPILNPDLSAVWTGAVEQRRSVLRSCYWGIFRFSHEPYLATGW